MRMIAIALMLAVLPAFTCAAEPDKAGATDPEDQGRGYTEFARDFAVTREPSPGALFGAYFGIGLFDGLFNEWRTQQEDPALEKRATAISQQLSRDFIQALDLYRETCRKLQEQADLIVEWTFGTDHHVFILMPSGLAVHYLQAGDKLTEKLLTLTSEEVATLQKKRQEMRDITGQRRFYATPQQMFSICLRQDPAEWRVVLFSSLAQRPAEQTLFAEVFRLCGYAPPVPPVKNGL